MTQSHESRETGSANSSAPPVVSYYSAAERPWKPRFSAIRVVGWFSIGALLVTYIGIYLAGGFRDPVTGLFVSLLFVWGEAGGLMLAIKIRALIKEQALRERPAAISVLAGVIHTVAMVAVIHQTSGRPQYHRDGRLYVLSGILGAAVLCTLTAWILTPHVPKDSASYPSGQDPP